MVGSGDINTLSASHDRIKYYNEWHPKNLELCTHTETVMTVTVEPGLRMVLSSSEVELTRVYKHHT